MNQYFNEHGLRVCYLFWCEGGFANHNKYYRMIENEDHQTFTAFYGREGHSPQTKVYPMSQWDKIYRQKTTGAKKYEDETLLHITEQKSSPSSSRKLLPISDIAIRDIMEFLQAAAQKSVQRNYSVTSNEVTAQMVQKAQQILNHLLLLEETEDFNESLLQLFHVIPRRMNNVKDYMAVKESDFAEIIKREQDVLDVMAGQVIQNQPAAQSANENNKVEQMTLLDVLGLEMQPVTPDEITMIKRLLEEDKRYFYRAVRVVNRETQKAYNQFNKENPIPDSQKRLLWHGSRNENWISILQSGLVLRPSNVVINGKMFGAGIYFAPKADKSLKYTSLSGSYWAHGTDKRAYMALFETAYGTPYHVTNNHGISSTFSYRDLQRVSPGASCLHAHAGQQLYNDEIIFYRQEQMTIKYLVELRI